MNFTGLDWGIAAVMPVGVASMTVISSRHTKSVADDLAAGRPAGRYMMTMASGVVWIGVTRGLTVGGMWDPANRLRVLKTQERDFADDGTMRHAAPEPGEEKSP